MYDSLTGKPISGSEIAESAALGAVFGVSASFGEYGFKGAGGLGFGDSFDASGMNAFDYVGKNYYDLALGTFATYSSVRLFGQ